MMTTDESALVGPFERVAIGADQERGSGDIAAVRLEAPDYGWIDYLIAAQCIFPFSVEMPCGSKVVFEKNEDFPRQTIPCPCGNPGHFIVVIKINSAVEKGGDQ